MGYGEFDRQLRWLMTVRVAVVTTLLVSAFSIELLFNPAQSLRPVFLLAAVSYGMVLLYAVLDRWLRGRRRFILLQLVGDVLVVTMFVHITGGLDSPMSFLYLLPISVDAESWAPVRLEAGETHRRETGNQAERTEHGRIEPDPDLVSGAFEESAGGIFRAIYEEDLLAPEADVVNGGDEGIRPDVKPGTVEVEYVVEEGDNLWTIAVRFLGKGHRNDEIIRLNSLASETLVPGMRLKLHVPENRAPKESLKSTPPADDKSVEKSSVLDESSLTLKTHKVKAREILGEIASRYFPGDPGGVEAIFEANRETVSSPDEIREGQILVIPSRR